jgi:hypothetical protein
MTDYQTNYETRYDGSLPNSLGTGQSDQFTGTRPQLFDDGGLPVDGYAELDQKWQLFDPLGTVLDFAGVNCRTQMAEVHNSGIKNLVGFYQQLPLPVAVGDVVERVIYGRSIVTDDGSNTATNASSNFAGIFLADGNLATDPDTTALTLAGVAIQRTDLTVIPVGFGSLGVIAGFVTFDALPNLIADAELVMSPFWRIRTRQSCTAPATFLSEAVIDISLSGADWNPLWPLATLTTLRTSFGMGIWCNDTFPGRLLQNFVEVLDQAFDDPGTLIGNTLRIGPV